MLAFPPPPRSCGLALGKGGARSREGSEDFTVQGPKGRWGRGNNPGSLPGGSEFLEGIRSAESPAGAAGRESPAPPPAHLWESLEPREAPPAPAPAPCRRPPRPQTAAEASAEAPAVGKGLLVRPRWEDIGKVPSPRATATVPRLPLRAGRARGAAHVRPRGAHGGTSRPPPTETPVSSRARRLGVPGTWQLHEVGPSFLPFRRGGHCSPGWLSPPVQSRTAASGRAPTARVRHMAPADQASEGPRLEDPSATHPRGKARRGACAGSEPPLLPLTATP